MKRSIAVLSAGLLMTAGIAIAQPRGPMWGRGMGEGRGPLGGLNLTDEQKAKMADLRVKFLKETEPVRADLEKQQSALRVEMTAEKFNDSRVKSIQAEMMKLQNDLGWKRITQQRAVRDLLTAEQQKTFDTRILAGGPSAGGAKRGPMQGGCGMGPGTGQFHQRGMSR